MQIVKFTTLVIMMSLTMTLTTNVKRASGQTCNYNFHERETHSNVIKIPSKQSVYRFNITIDHATTMAIWNEHSETYDPVIYEACSFWLRDKNMLSACNARIRRVDNERDQASIIVAGGLQRSLMLINRMLPGLPIVVRAGSTVEVTVHNQLMSEVLTLHWHGQAQRKSFVMDGVPFVTQCPIMPGESYTYTFIAADGGTHWYHAHSGLQRTEGVYAPFIVYPNSYNETKYEREFFFTIQDFSISPSHKLFDSVNWGNIKFANGAFHDEQTCYKPSRLDDGTYGPFQPFLPGDVIMVNGHGWWDLPAFARQITETVYTLPIERFVVKPNKKYLFRVIGANAGNALEIRFGGHNMTIVASDGNPIEPITNVDSLIVNSGERYDVVIDTLPTATQNFLIVVQTLERFTYEFENMTQEHYGVAMLRYEGAPTSSIQFQDACSSPSRKCRKVNCPFWPETVENYPFECVNVGSFKSSEAIQLDQQLLKNNYPKGQLTELFLNLHFAGPNQRAMINNAEFKLPQMPPFFTKDSTTNIHKCDQDEKEFKKCSRIEQITLGSVTQLIITNYRESAGINNSPHPFHMHGHHFYVVAMGFGTYRSDSTAFYSGSNPDISCSMNQTVCVSPSWSKSEYEDGNVPNANLVNPPIKDTVFVPVGGYIVIRFKADNPGYWFLHCHIEVHQGEGMSLIIQEGTDDQIRNIVDFNQLTMCGKGAEFGNSGKNDASSKSLSTNFQTFFCVANGLMIYSLV